MTEIILIAAAAENNALGKDNDLVWNLPDDFRRFKKLTSGHQIIMGRKTFESFPGTLPNREHIIITRDKEYMADYKNCTVVHSLSDAISYTKNSGLVYIIGGGEIYEQALPLAHKIELTRVHANFKDADTFFPKIDFDDWVLVSETPHKKDSKHDYAFTYLTYIKKTPAKNHDIPLKLAQ